MHACMRPVKAALAAHLHPRPTEHVGQVTYSVDV